MLNTGPSLQTHTFPAVVFSTQHRQAPMPHPITFSSETSQKISLDDAIRATDFIIGNGPQQYMLLKLFVSILFCVTNPFSP